MDNNQQIVQLFRNNKILANRDEAINFVNYLNDKFSNSPLYSDVGVLDGEPIIIRYFNESGSVETYMTVAVEEGGHFYLSHIVDKIDTRIFDRTIQSVSGDIYSKIEQTASSITQSVNDTLKGYTKRDETADQITDIVGEVLKSANTYYIVSDKKPNKVPETESPYKYGWSLDYPDYTLIKDGEYIWTFTRYVYSNDDEGNPVITDTEISKIKVGQDGTTYYTWIAYSDKGSASTECYDSPYDDNGKVRPYVGFAENQTSPKEEYVVSKYKWSEIKGEKGVSGDSGYIWILYADDLDKQENGVKYPSVAYQQPKDSTQYIGILSNQKTENEETSEEWLKKYKWSKFKGDDGVGITYYTWVKYSDSNSTDNKIDNTLSDSPRKNDKSFYKYIGFGYNKLSAETSASTADTMNRSSYVWTVYDATRISGFKLIPIICDANVDAKDNLNVDIEFSVYDMNGDKTLSSFTEMNSAELQFAVKDNVNNVFSILNDNKYKNSEYQKNYHTINDGSEVTSITVSMWKKGNPMTDETAMDRIIVNVGYKKEAIRTFTNDYILDSIENENGAINKAISTASSYTRTIIDGENKERFSKIEQSVSGISGTVHDISGRTSSLEQRADGFDASINGLNGDVNNIKIDINGLKTNKGVSAQTLVTNSVSGGPYISISEGEINIYRASSAETPNIRFGYSETNASGGTINSMVLAFYDNNGTLLYDLGPDGLVWANIGQKYYKRPKFTKLGTGIKLTGSTLTDVYKELTNTNHNYLTSNKEINIYTFESGKSGITVSNGYVQYTDSDYEDTKYLWTNVSNWDGQDSEQWEDTASTHGEKVGKGWYIMNTRSGTISYKTSSVSTSITELWTAYVEYLSVVIKNNNGEVMDDGIAFGNVKIAHKLKLKPDNSSTTTANNDGYYYTFYDPKNIFPNEVGNTKIENYNEGNILARIIQIDDNGSKINDLWLLFQNYQFRGINDSPFNGTYNNIQRQMMANQLGTLTPIAEI